MFAVYRFHIPESLYSIYSLFNLIKLSNIYTKSQSTKLILSRPSSCIVVKAQITVRTSCHVRSLADSHCRVFVDRFEISNPPDTAHRKVMEFKRMSGKRERVFCVCDDPYM